VAALRQTNFLGGELSPLLWGRTDLPEFARGLRRMNNFFPTRQGMALSRPGTVVVNTAKYPSQPQKVRLVPFVVSDSLSYVLEVGSDVYGTGYMRFHRLGATVLDSFLVIVEIATPWKGQHLPLLQWAQTGDVMTFTCGSDTPGLYSPYELTRDPRTGNWSLAQVSFAVSPSYFIRLPAADAPSSKPIMVIAANTFTADATHAKQLWAWRVTANLQDATGRQYEGLPVSVDQGFDGTNPISLTTFTTSASDDGISLVLSADRPVTFRRMYASFFGPGLMPPAGTKVVSYNFYRGRGGLFGFVGTTTGDDFVDTGVSPDYTLQPPRAQDPFQIPSGPYDSIDTPSAVCFYQERRVFSGLKRRPASVLLSASGNYTDFDSHLLATADQALEYALAARKRETVRAMLPLGRLLLFTDSSVWSMGGGQGSPLSALEVPQVQVEDEVGSLPLHPLVVGGSALYVRAKGRGVRALTPDASQSFPGGFAGADLSSHAEHLFTGGDSFGSAAGVGLVPTITPKRQIVDWAYAEDPFGIVWAVRADGALLSLTYAKGAFAAWAQHDTYGTVESVCVVPETSEDAVYLAVRRPGTGLTIERMASRVVNGDANDGCAVDGAFRFEVLASTVTAGTTLNLFGAYVGAPVWVCGAGITPQGPFAPTAAGIVLTADIEANKGSYAVFYVGLPFTPELETLDVAQTDARLKSKTVTRVGIEVNETRGLEVGQDFDDLEEYQQRQVTDSYGVISAATDLVTIDVAGTWDTHARACLRQSLPLQVAVLGITRDVDVGG